MHRDQAINHQLFPESPGSASIPELLSEEIDSAKEEERSRSKDKSENPLRLSLEKVHQFQLAPKTATNAPEPSHK